MESIELPEGLEKSKLNGRVALAVTLFSAFMAVAKVKDDNLVRLMMQAQVSANDTWSEYQAKKIKLHVSENTAAMLTSLAPTSDVTKYQESVTRYAADAEELKSKAEGFEKKYETLDKRHDQFDLADALMSIGIALLAMTALTGRIWLFAIALTAGVGGLAFGIAGFADIAALHPDFIIEWLK